MSIYNAELSENTLIHTIVKASHLHNTLGRDLLQDTTFLRLLKKLDQNIEATREEMQTTGVLSECADCALHGEGTCCGLRTGYKCDSILLFINLLLGRSVSDQPKDPQKCFFLTDKGCSLRARPVICVNFVCNRLRDKIPHEQLVRLQEIAGAELDMLFATEEYIKKMVYKINRNVRN
jgi:hypothetical protein